MFCMNIVVRRSSSTSEMELIMLTDCVWIRTWWTSGYMLTVTTRLITLTSDWLLFAKINECFKASFLLFSDYERKLIKITAFETVQLLCTVNLLSHKNISHPLFNDSKNSLQDFLVKFKVVICLLWFSRNAVESVKWYKLGQV